MNTISIISGKINHFATKIHISSAYDFLALSQQTLQHGLSNNFMGLYFYSFYSFDDRYVLPELFN